MASWMRSFKICNKCDEELPLEEFRKRTDAKNSYRGTCLKCEKFLMREYGKKYREKLLERCREWYKENKEEHLQKGADRQRQRLKTDPLFRFRKGISNKVYIALKKTKGLRNRRSIFDALPYSLKDLKRHIESQFDSKMSWDNYGKYWTLDHIVPQSYFSYTSLTDPKFLECWALSNLRPLPKLENMSKNSFYEGRRCRYENVD